MAKYRYLVMYKKTYPSGRSRSGQIKFETRAGVENFRRELKKEVKIAKIKTTFKLKRIK